ncbi:MAG: 2OG-Fe dioxygenase family protein [Xanthomonadales bacterium]|nr:2OG-Fe dioxygenase family protein [Xanthomonadales bacterium]
MAASCGSAKRSCSRHHPGRQSPTSHCLRCIRTYLGKRHADLGARAGALSLAAASGGVAAICPRPIPGAAETLTTIQHELVHSGFCFLPAAQGVRWLGDLTESADWAEFADSWQGMPLDGYMADQGRYRRRRHAVYHWAAGNLARAAHQPHYQSTEYNPLNGGVERWFEPIPESIGTGAILPQLLTQAAACFTPLRPTVKRWRLELHQFRIEAHADEPGQPTPEGSHRDGVDFVLVLLISRHNIARGCTSISTPDGRSLGEFTLAAPLDLALVDDHRVHHGVTAVEAIDASQPAWRDVLVVTFKADD